MLPDTGKCLLCSKSSNSERAMVVGLGGLNLFGVIILGTMLKYGSVDITCYLVLFGSVDITRYLVLFFPSISL